MYIKKLGLCNFMPFNGDHEIDFHYSAKQNICIIFGDNQRGKTSILRAMRFALYGKVYDRRGRPIRRVDLVNWDAAGESEWEMSVSVVLDVDGSEFEVRRKINKLGHVYRPDSDADFEEVLGMRENGRPLRADEIERRIDQLLPEEISRFFLFDAELLQEFEELVGSDAAEQDKLVEAVEQILGVPALLNGRVDLQTVQKQAQREQTRDLRQEGTFRKIAIDLEQLQEKSEKLIRDKAEIEERRTAAEAEIDELTAVVDASERYHEAKVELTKVEERIQELEREETRLEEDGRRLLRDAWRDMLRPLLGTELERLEKERGELEESIVAHTRLTTEVDNLESLLAKRVCPLCMRDIDEATRTEAGARLRTIEAELESADLDRERLQTLGLIAGRLRKSLDHESIRQRFVATREAAQAAAIGLTRAENRREDLQSLLKGRDTAEIARQRSKRDALLGERGRLRGDLKAVEADLKKNLETQERLSSTIAGNTSVRTRRSTRKYRLVKELVGLFESGIGSLRDDLRASVEAAATQTFLRLTSEPGYLRLRINHKFGLSILDQEGRVVSVRSAGAEQIVALSLIDALNRTAQAGGPIVFDMPFGRLDLKHRENVLRVLPEMGSQAVLLVHEGELDRQRDLEGIGDRIGVVYEIERITSSTSRLRAL